MPTDLHGVWKSTDKRENRYVYVHRTDSAFAYARSCSPNGMAHPKAREVRIRLNANRDGVQRYRRPTTDERSGR